MPAKPPSESPHELVTLLLEAAVKFVALERGQALVRKWMPRRESGFEGASAARIAAMVEDAAAFAGDLLLSQPAASGATAFDRLARNPAGLAPEAVRLIQALCKARYRLLAVERAVPHQGWMMRDVISGEALFLVQGDLPPLAVDTALFGRVMSIGPATFCFAGEVTPLDMPALMVARQHPAAGAPNAAAAVRWAEAVYAHVVRYGTLEVPGLNVEDDQEDEPVSAALHELGTAWAALQGAPADAVLLQRTRQAAEVPDIVNGLAAAVLSRDTGRTAMADAFERLLLVQLETVWHRERSTAMGVTFDMIARGVAAAGLPPRVRDLFDTLRKRVTGGRAAEDPALERLVARIQALRAKTVAQGCTEQEALAAAEKVAELLDRHGLSLNELEYRAQPCEGVGVQTNRKRAAPIDGCVPSIAAYFDCRVWQERHEGAALRYMFFGLRGDVAAAQYLYEMVERAFETETEAFRASEIYFAMAGDRRSASHSFQTGMAQGIAGKLQTMRKARDAVIRSASGRDLVPVKAAMVDEELEKLGLSLSVRKLGGAKRVLTDAFHAGQEAGARFEVAPGIAQSA